MDRIVVVGASAAGLTVAEALRRNGHTDALVVIGDEIHLPYDRPPLSKQVLRGAWELEKTALRTQSSLDALSVDWRLGTAATALDTSTRTVTLADGCAVGYDRLVIATGVAARKLPGAPTMRGLHVLRTLDHALALRDELRAGPRVVVIGAGFLGAEAAAVARELGLDVTMVDPLPAPMVRQFGRAVGDLVADLHRERGVHLRLGTGVVDVSSDADADADVGRVRGVRLDTGEVLPAEVVLVAIGSRPNTAWLDGSGLSVTDGVDCDEHGRAADNVYAAGDVANWWQPALGRRVRVEHRMNATEQGTAVARTLLGIDHNAAVVPYFWTDQFDVRIQVYGTPSQDAQLRVTAGDPGEGKFAAVYEVGGRIVAGLAWRMPREAREMRQLVLDGAMASSAG